MQISKNIFHAGLAIAICISSAHASQSAVMEVDIEPIVTKIMTNKGIQKKLQKKSQDLDVKLAKLLETAGDNDKKIEQLKFQHMQDKYAISVELTMIVEKISKQAAKSIMQHINSLPKSKRPALVVISVGKNYITDIKFYTKSIDDMTSKISKMLAKLKMSQILAKASDYRAALAKYKAAK